MHHDKELLLKLEAISAPLDNDNIIDIGNDIFIEFDYDDNETYNSVCEVIRIWFKETDHMKILYTFKIKEDEDLSFMEPHHYIYWVTQTLRYIIDHY